MLIGSDGWTDIAGATSDTYTPASDDAGMFLRATASYTDGEGPGKTASKVSSNTVQAPADTDTSLRSLSFGKIPFVLNGSTLQYTVSVPNSVAVTKVKAVATTEPAVSVAITPADSSTSKGGHQVDLSEGENEIGVAVSDDQGHASTAYLVTIDRRSASESLSASCSSDLSDWLVAFCGAGEFADYRMELDGSYTIDWSDWDSEHSGVTKYSVILEQFISRTYHRGRGTEGASALSNVYESCESTDGQWSCGGPVSNVYYEDSAGNPTQARTLSSNLKRTQWSSALETLGTTSSEAILYRWDGDGATEPTAVTYSIKDVEVDRYSITPRTRRGSLTVQNVMVAGVASFNNGAGR